jgi:uncharacterized membrane protein
MYVGLQWFSPRVVAMVIGIGALGNLWYLRPFRYQTRLLVPLVGTLLLSLFSAFWNQSHAILYLPFLIAINFGLSFGYSLWHPPSMVEVFARMRSEDLTEEAVRYCRLVTGAWMVFFVINATLAGFTACCTSLATWSLYNGLISYGIVGVLFTVELFYRYWRFRRYVGSPTDFLFKRIFPPRA